MDASERTWELAARHVLSRFIPFAERASLLSLGNRGGFSGAHLWRVEAAGRTFCLKAWPIGESSPKRLCWIHGLMQRAREVGLTIVPHVESERSGKTCVEEENRVWDLTNWMPGAADFQQRPSCQRLEAACVAIARLHQSWRLAAISVPGPVPAVSRRLRKLEEWQALVHSGWRPVFGSSLEPLDLCGARAWQLLPARVEHVAAALVPFADGGSLVVQPCHGDVWHDHVLFEGENVSGLIDLGSARMDHVAVDLARLLGSLVGDNAAWRRAGLQAYAAECPSVSKGFAALVDVLDRTGTVLALANWLRWLYADGRSFEDRARVAERVAGLVNRIEAWA